ncbi:DASH complex subunit Dad3 family protein [Candida parapsilosis]|uniref:DASH complex subunit DAD3 n=2 Tax=Candida parapsilosis TaxID=5480 RepID=G8BG64_CANPC|nr:uncharacterized protein CPAR2_204910 [Candida parapsilosis]KAF6055004.1 DASH complex subunit Dad3 family protein [Candida parapsilosis]KAF6055973.1 DASH complex subunit Dad3 family protein [Candida parapsilosis]KAF6058903.1 DASH complex subunit Dad3 family protein [Candida parapsilosis]KAF6067660.1 DASH complex subunit Dad3 family protein [Candida parapsilosis]KAI5901889.1 DASH complex subunit DAD2 [Candida parapsilosis]
MDIDYTTKPNLTELEASVLIEYQNINDTLIQLNQRLKSLTNKDEVDGGESIRSVETLRQMETKLSLIYTFFRGAVYTLYADVGEGMEEDGDTQVESEEEVGDDNDAEEYGKGANELSSISDT